MKNSYIFLHINDSETPYIDIYIDLLSINLTLLPVLLHCSYNQVSDLWNLYCTSNNMAAKHIVHSNIIIYIYIYIYIYILYQNNSYSFAIKFTRLIPGNVCLLCATWTLLHFRYRYGTIALSYPLFFIDDSSWRNAA